MFATMWFSFQNLIAGYSPGEHLYTVEDLPEQPASASASAGSCSMLICHQGNVGAAFVGLLPTVKDIPELA